MNDKGFKQLKDLGVTSVCYVVVSGPQTKFDLPVPNEHAAFVQEKYLLVRDQLI